MLLYLRLVRHGISWLAKRGKVRQWQRQVPGRRLFQEVVVFRSTRTLRVEESLVGWNITYSLGPSVNWALPNEECTFIAVQWGTFVSLPGLFHNPPPSARPSIHTYATLHALATETGTGAGERAPIVWRLTRPPPFEWWPINCTYNIIITIVPGTMAYLSFIVVHFGKYKIINEYYAVAQ